jgi:beta-xylosidase
MRVFIVCLLLSLLSVSTDAQVSRVWVADNGDGTYKNPIIDADYSDPDAIRVGDDYYLTASSFDAIPGLPILHSRDLVNWTIIGHALLRQPPYDHFSAAQHGNGVWAPAIRYHKGEYYIYYPDPDYGIYVTRAKTPSGPWSLPVLVEAGKGLIDPCPLWDDDGKVYLVHAYARVVLYMTATPRTRPSKALSSINETATIIFLRPRVAYPQAGNWRCVRRTSMARTKGKWSWTRAAHPSTAHTRAPG